MSNDGLELFPSEAVSAFITACSAVAGVVDKQTLVALYGKLHLLGVRIVGIAEASGIAVDDKSGAEFATLLTSELGAYVGVAATLAQLAGDAEKVSPVEMLTRAERVLDQARGAGGNS